MTLHKLLSHMDRAAFEPEVISLTTLGDVGERMRALGVPVRVLGMRRGVPDPIFVARLAGLLRKESPDIVQTWMYHADLIGGLAAKLAANLPVVWNVRHSHLHPGQTNRTTVWTARACARLSGSVPERIICAAEVSRRVHAKLGYKEEKMVVIPNGFDLSVFVPDVDARISVRRELGIPQVAPLVGLVARFHPDKDHYNFVRAAALLDARRPNVHFLLCGEGVTPENRELLGRLRSAGILDRCRLLGRRNDLPRLYAALDVAVSSSSSEGFPNVVGEAMACGVPCVVTDVGDSADIVADTGVVVSPRDPEALATGLREVLGLRTEERRALGDRARKRMGQHYSLRSVVAAYEQIYEGLVPGRGRGRPSKGPLQAP